MPTNRIYEDRIKSFDWDALSDLWLKICDRTTTPDWGEHGLSNFDVTKLRYE